MTPLQWRMVHIPDRPLIQTQENVMEIVISPDQILILPFFVIVFFIVAMVVCIWLFAAMFYVIAILFVVGIIGFLFNPLTAIILLLLLIASLSRR